MSSNTTDKTAENEAGMDVATELSLMLARLDNLESELSKEDDASKCILTCVRFGRAHTLR
jgi:hypothetical protein